jgi:hypothetical protein
MVEFVTRVMMAFVSLHVAIYDPHLMELADDKYFSISLAPYCLEGRACSSLEALLSRLPVNNVPDRLEVLSLAVLVLEAVELLAIFPLYLTKE